MRGWIIGLAALMAGCVSVSVEDHSSIDATLIAMQNAHVRECPAGRTQANAHSAGFGASSGVAAEDIGFADTSDAARVVRLRRIIVEPGGVIPWHDHATLQGMAMLVSGEMVERRNSCLDPIVYRAGDVAREDAATAHSWRNDGDTPAVILVTHVMPRP